jgi:signal transduction histidine kinase
MRATKQYSDRELSPFSYQPFSATDINTFSEQIVKNFVEIFHLPAYMFYEYSIDRKSLHLFHQVDHITINVPPFFDFDGDGFSKRDSFLLENEGVLKEKFSPLGLSNALIAGMFNANGILNGFVIGYLSIEREVLPNELSLFSTMALQAGLHLQNLRINEQLQQQIEYNNALEDKLTAKDKEVRLVNEDLEQFAYIISHDLKAPLRNIKSFSQLLQKMYADKLDGDGMTFLDFITGGVAKFEHLIDDLLQYSRVSKRDMNFEEINLNTIIKEVIKDAYISVSKKEAAIKSERLPKIIGDAHRIEQLLSYIIDNSIKFRQKDVKAQIEISSQDKGEFVEIAIKDNGIGIEEEYYERIFQLFQKLHADKDYKGTGLGLSICKKIVERHKGKIWIFSDGSNKGTTMNIRLPKDLNNIRK